jgi:probable HAF family extracellular repeat protein
VGTSGERKLMGELPRNGAHAVGWHARGRRGPTRMSVTRRTVQASSVIGLQDCDVARIRPELYGAGNPSGNGILERIRHQQRWSGRRRYFRWRRSHPRIPWTQAGGMQNLGVLPGTEDSVATAVSGNGQVVVGYSRGNPAPPDRAYRWSESQGMQDLGLIPGALEVRAYAYATIPTVPWSLLRPVRCGLPRLALDTAASMLSSAPCPRSLFHRIRV